MQKPPNIGLSKDQIKNVTKLLNQVLADEFVLYMRTRKYHWNVTGVHFNDLHKFFEQQYIELETNIDDAAERARTIGGLAVGTLQEYKELTRLEETPNDYPEAMIMLKNLTDGHEAIIRELRTDIEKCTEELDDAGTADFLTQLMEKHEKTAWMLRSMLGE